MHFNTSPQVILLHWNPASSLAELLGKRRPPNSRHLRENSFLFLFPHSICFKKRSLLPCPLPVVDAPRLCLQQKVKPPRFDRRLPEFPTDYQLPGQGISNLYFLVFWGCWGQGSMQPLRHLAVIPGTAAFQASCSSLPRCPSPNSSPGGGGEEAHRGVRQAASDYSHQALQSVSLS